MTTFLDNSRHYSIYQSKYSDLIIYFIKKLLIKPIMLLYNTIDCDVYKILVNVKISLIF